MAGALTRCNAIHYLGVASSIGGLNDDFAAAEVFANFKVAVIGKQTGGAITDLKWILAGSRAISPTMKWFGYTILGTPPAGAAQNIAGATNATPIVINQVAHGILTGDLVNISGVLGNTAANNNPASGAWTVTKIDADHYSLNTSVGNGAYTGGTGVAWTYPLWLASMTQWATDIPAPNTLDGIFIDSFGADFGLGSRAYQNNAIAAIHAAGYNAYVNAAELEKLFGSLDGEAAPVIGTASAHPDYFLIEDYFRSRSASTREVTEHRLGRAAFAAAAYARAAGIFVNVYVNPVVMLGSGGASNISAVDFNAVTAEIASFGTGGLPYLGIGASDYGATSHLYFWNRISNLLE